VTTQFRYPLVQTKNEFDRLIEQGRFYGELTDRVLRAAGFRKGMRVLDVGCGAGDVSFLLARLVGPRGIVVGVDQSAAAITIAQKRADGAGLENMEFLVSELRDFSSPQLFDAAFGRFVLIYQSDPVAALRHVASQVRIGGMVAFQETDCSHWPPARLSDSPLLAQVGEWFRRTYVALGAEMQMGIKLPRLFEQAGLPVPRTRVESRLVTNSNSPYYHLIAEFIRTLLPTMERLGIATAAEVEVETLEDRTRAEIRALGTVVMTPPLVGAWARRE
jgi:2-polyprenyl-3-methyl-5-hydroxy-6-metoxy-1,4-benzoquinol methylase